MRCHSELDLATMLRETRETLGLSQRRLAVRAGTSQDAISRIERGVEAPTLERFERLMLSMGLRLVIDVEPLESPIGIAGGNCWWAGPPGRSSRYSEKRKAIACLSGRLSRATEP